MRYHTPIVRAVLLATCLLICPTLSMTPIEAAVVRYIVTGLPESARVGVPFDISVRGVDTEGSTVSLGAPPLQLRAIEAEEPPTMLLSEWYLRQGVELMNVSTRTQNLSGWELQLFSRPELQQRDRVPSLAYVFPAGTQCLPGRVVTIGPSAAGLTPKVDFALSIPAELEGDMGLLALVDDTGQTRDVYRPNQMGLNGGDVPEWLSSHDWVNSNPGRTRYYASRTGGVDHNDNRDWSQSNFSFGSPNPGIRMPFPGSSVERSIEVLSAELRDGVWRARVRFLEPGKAIRLQANSLTGIDGTTDPIDVSDAPELSLTVPESVVEGGRVTATLKLSPAATVPERVRLAFQLHGERLRFPSEIVVPPGADGVSFDIEAIENARLEGTWNLRLVAHSDEGGRASAALRLLDNEDPGLHLKFAAVLEEGSAPYALTARLYLDRATDAPLALQLASSLPERFAVQSRVIFPQGATDADFKCTVNPDLHTTGDLPITLTVAEPSFGNVQSRFILRDTVKNSLRVEYGSLTEGAPTATNKFRVFLTAPIAREDTVVTLRADNPELLEVPKQVVISAGTTNAAIPVRALDDGITNRDRTVTVHATAPGFSEQVFEVYISDNQAGDLYVGVTRPESIRARTVSVQVGATTKSGTAVVFDGDVTLRLIDSNGVPIDGFIQKAHLHNGGTKLDFPMPRRTIPSASIEADLGGVVKRRTEPFDWVDGWVSTNSYTDCIRDPLRHQLLAVSAIQGKDSGTYLTSLDPSTGSELWRLLLETNVNTTPALAMSSDARFLYVGLSGTGGVVRANLSNHTLDQTFSLDSTNSAAQQAFWMAVSPGDAEVLMVLRASALRVPFDTALFQSGKRLPLSIPHWNNDYSRFGDSRNDTCFFVGDAGHAFTVANGAWHRVWLTTNGLTMPNIPYSLSYGPDPYFNGKPILDRDRVHLQSGIVLEPENLQAISGSGYYYQGVVFEGDSIFDLDPNRGRMYRLFFRSAETRLYILEPEASAPIYSLKIPDLFPFASPPKSLLYWDSSQVSFISGGRLFMVRHLLSEPASDSVLTLSQQGSYSTNGIMRPMTYQLRLSNAGPAAVESSFVTHRLPEDVRFLGMLSSQGVAGETNRNIKWFPGLIPPGGVVTLSIDISADSPGAYGGKATLYTPSAFGAAPTLYLTNWFEVLPPIPHAIPYSKLSFGQYDSQRDRYYFQESIWSVPVYMDWRTGLPKALPNGPTNTVYSFSLLPGGKILYMITQEDRVLRYDLDAGKLLSPIVPGGNILAFAMWKGHPDTVAVTTTSGLTSVYVNGAKRGFSGAFYSAAEPSLFWSDDGKFLYQIGRYDDSTRLLMRQPVTNTRVGEVEQVAELSGFTYEDRDWVFMAGRFFSTTGVTFPVSNPNDLLSLAPSGHLYRGVIADHINGVVLYTVQSFSPGPVGVAIDPSTLKIKRQGRVDGPLPELAFHYAGTNRFLVRSGDKTWAVDSSFGGADFGTNALVELSALIFPDDLDAISIQAKKEVEVQFRVRNEGASFATLQSIRGTLPPGVMRTDVPNADASNFEMALIPSVVFSGERSIVTIKLTADRPGTYPIPVTASWKNGAGQAFETLREFKLNVATPPVADVQVLTTAKLIRGVEGDFVRARFLVTNAGPDRVKNIILRPTTGVPAMFYGLWDGRGYDNGATWDIPALEPGTGQWIEATTTLTTEGFLRLFALEAFVEGSLDPNPANNIAESYLVSSFPASKSGGRGFEFAATDMAADPRRDVLYFAPSNARDSIGNHVWRLDLASGDIAPWLPAPSPSLVAVDADGDTVYAASSNAGLVTRMSIRSDLVKGTLRFGDPVDGVARPAALAPSPVQAGTLAVALMGAEGQCEVRIYDGDQARPNVVRFAATLQDNLETLFSSSGDELYLRLNETLTRYRVGGDGIFTIAGADPVQARLFELYGNPTHVLSDRGTVYLPQQGTVFTNLPAVGVPMYDGSRALLYLVSSAGYPANGQVTAFDAATHEMLWSWGTDFFSLDLLKKLVTHEGRLAFLSKNGTVFGVPNLDQGGTLRLIDPAPLHSPPQADLSLQSLSARPIPLTFEIGERYTNTWIVSNAGPYFAKGFHFLSGIPEGFTYRTSTITAGSSQISKIAFDVSIPVLAPQTSASVSLVLEATATHESTLESRVESEIADAHLDNNATNVTLEVLRPLILTSQPWAVLEPADQGQRTSESFTVTLSRLSRIPVSFRVSNVDDTAKAGTDYAAFSKVLTIPPGSQLVNHSIQINYDKPIEGDERFFVRISDVTNAFAPESLIPWTIKESPPAVTLSNESAVESDAIRGQIKFQIGLSSPTLVPVKIGLKTVSGTATGEVDFKTRESIIVIPAGQTNATFSVQAMDDLAEEGDETLFLVVTSVANATPPLQDGIGVILDDDGQYKPVITNISPFFGGWSVSAKTVVGSTYSWEMANTIATPVWKSLAVLQKATTNLTTLYIRQLPPSEKNVFFRVIRSN